MTLPVSTSTSAAAQAYQAASGKNAGAANTAFSAAASAEPQTEASNGSTLNSSMLSALLGMNSPGSGTTTTQNSSNPADGSAGAATSAAHHHHGISAYMTQLANSAASAMSSV